MTDTIELLIAIGSDASLRYALPCDLKGVLEQRGASIELKMAVTTGDGTPLRVELKLQGITQVQQIHSPGHEGDDEGEVDPPKPKPRQPGKSPSRPPSKKPKPGK
jgi:hypothetical protein